MENQCPGFKGTIVGIGLNDVIQLICTSTNNHVKIKVKSGLQEGIICVANGQIVHAQTLQKEGEFALYEILSWPGGEFSVAPTEPSMIGKITIHKPWEQLILESARLKDEGLHCQKEETEKIAVYCENCEKRLMIPSDKIPFGKKIRIKCPVCQNNIELIRENQTKNDFEIEIERWKREEAIADDIFMDGREGMLICSSDDQALEKLSRMFSQEDYNIKTANTGREAFKYLREGLFQIVILDEAIGKTGSNEHGILLFYIQKLPMTIRRNLFLCLISDSLKTGDRWAAFRLGVDLVVNRGSIDLVDELLHYTIGVKKRFYAPFMEELQLLRSN